MEGRNTTWRWNKFLKCRFFYLCNTMFYFLSGYYEEGDKLLQIGYNHFK